MSVETAPADKVGWWRDVTGYQWLVFLTASMAWLFDNTDQRLFSLARIPALSNLMHLPGADVGVQAMGKIATACFLVGWGIGGLTLGALGDRFGRVRLLTISILIYSICTGLTALSQTAEQFALLRFLTGFGIGGVFGLAVALVAETVSGAARLAMLGVLQVLSTVGNVGAAVIKSGIDHLADAHVVAFESSWRWAFAVGAIPALLAVVSGLFLKESENWRRLRDSGGLAKGWLLGSYRELLAESGQRRNLLIGSLLAVAGVVGLWAIGEYAVDLQDAVFSNYYRGLGVADVKSQVAHAKDVAYVLQMLGGTAGMFAFTWIAAQFGRRPAFLIGFTAALIATVYSYAAMKSPADAFWMMPLMGAGQLSVFAGYSIYLPELFGSKARSTGVSFAYNLGRFAAAAGSFFSAVLTTRIFAGFASPAPLRYSAMTMCLVFLLGLGAALFAPETRGRPLPP